MQVWQQDFPGMSQAKRLGNTIVYGNVKSSRYKAGWSYPHFIDTYVVCVYANVIIYIAILYIPIFKIKYTWGREATIWKNGFLWLYFCFIKYFKPVKHDGPVWWASDWD